MVYVGKAKPSKPFAYRIYAFIQLTLLGGAWRRCASLVVELIFTPVWVWCCAGAVCAPAGLCM